MTGWRYRLGLRLSRIGFVKDAIANKADLSAFRQPPPFRIILGMFLIVFSFCMCWPVITALPVIAAYLKQPLILAIGPIVYFSSHGVFIIGITLTGTVHPQIILRWAARKGVEKLLASGPVSPQPAAMEPAVMEPVAEPEQPPLH